MAASGGMGHRDANNWMASGGGRASGWYDWTAGGREKEFESPKRRTFGVHGAGVSPVVLGTGQPSQKRKRTLVGNLLGLSAGIGGNRWRKSPLDHWRCCSGHSLLLCLAPGPWTDESGTVEADTA